MTERIRGRRLQAVRARVLRAQPLCVACLRMGRIVPATEVDHIVALANGGADTDENRQGLCPDCHEAKTRADMGYAPRGCDASGLPTDPRHAWVKTEQAT